MNGRKLFGIFALLAMFVSSVVAAEVNEPRLELVEKIQKEIVYTPEYGTFDSISFELKGDTVILSGKVLTLGLKKRAENSIRDIEGVKEVINNIEYLPPSSFDNRIRRDLVRAFYNGGSLYRFIQSPRPSVRLIVENGRVTLEGFVTTRGDYDLANILVRGIPGVFEVDNNLVVTKVRNN